LHQEEEDGIKIGEGKAHPAKCRFLGWERPFSKTEELDSKQSPNLSFFTKKKKKKKKKEINTQA
jgi:hypothetical protein